jgi:DnaJ-domain-containing protein 1
VDPIFKRLNNLFRSQLSGDAAQAERPSRISRDRDFDEAMDELDDYLNNRPKAEPGTGPGANGRTYGHARGASGPGAGGAAGSGQHGSSQAGSTSGNGRKDPKEELRKDYANLGVAFGAAFAEVRKAYRTQLKTYHPDRFAVDPEKFKTATEITKKINESFQRIERFHETGVVS